MIPGASVGEVVLAVDGVGVRKGSTRVLDRVTFEVRDRIRVGATTGQVVALLGPSGIGKTSLLRVIAGLDTPDAGTVRGQGGAPLDPRRVGLVFQHYPLLEHRTVEENLRLAGRIGGLSPERTAARTRELLARVGLEDRAHVWPAQLSGGQRQRAAIAQQLVLPRRVLLLDEPFSGLDPAALADVCRLVVEVANEHELNTVVVVTHDVDAALGVSDTVILLGRANAGARAATVQSVYDLVAMDLAWEHGRTHATARARLVREIEARFRDAA